MKKILTLALLSAFALVAVSCGGGGEETKPEYTVTFNADGGTPAPAAQKVKEGETVTAPAAMTKTGYVFMFWSQNGTAAYNFSTPVTGNITLSAHWQSEATAEYWQVEWSLNGGTWPSGDNHATQVVKGGTLAEPAAPTKTGSTFDGWYKEEALTNKITFPYDVSTITADFTLYAKWTTGGGGEEPGNTMVASGRYGYFVLNANGVLQASGRNEYGQLGTGNETDVERLTQITTNVSAVYARGNSAFILKKDGSLLGAGYNSEGNLGLGDEDNRTSFTTIPVTDVKTIAAGEAHTLLLKNNGSVWASGFNAYGRLGVGDETQRDGFVETNLQSNVTAIAAGLEHSLALRADGSVWGAGFGYEGALGQEAVNVENTSFVPIFTYAKAIAAGNNFSLILAENGTVWASGQTQYGRLGIGSDQNDFLKQFVQVVDDTNNLPLTDVVAIAAGYYHSLALKADGTLWAAGRIILGTGEFVDKYGFVQIASNVASMSAGRTHSVVLKKDGTTQVYGHVNPWDRLNGNSRFLISVDDIYYGRYISSWELSYGGTEIARSTFSIDTGKPAAQISVKPGIYTMTFRTSNSSIPFGIVDIVVEDDEDVIIRYEYVPSKVNYQWTVIKAPH